MIKLINGVQIHFFFLSSSESPGTVLATQPLLGTKNYHPWSRAMVISWMMNSLHIDISCSVMYCETAREVWIELKNRYSQGNAPKIYNLQKEISHICQNQLNAADYFTKFKCLWDQLLNYDSLPECSCGAMKALNDYHDNSYVMKFLMSLNESFSTIRSQILMSNPLPSIGKVYSFVLQEEAQKHIGRVNLHHLRMKLLLCMQTPSSILEIIAILEILETKESFFKGGNPKERNMLGHIVDKCYKIHGYPPGYRAKGKSCSSANQVSIVAPLSNSA